MPQNTRLWERQEMISDYSNSAVQSWVPSEIQGYEAQWSIPIHIVLSLSKCGPGIGNLFIKYVQSRIYMYNAVIYIAHDRMT